MQVYKKSNAIDILQYVTVVNTTKATINNVIGAVTGTPNTRVRKKLLTQFWQNAVNQNTSSRKARVVVNGKPLISTNRPVPHALVVYAGK